MAVTTVWQEDYQARGTNAPRRRIVDVYETPFGIRTIKFDPNVGYLINGEHVLLNGTCNHADLGALGAAVNFRALQRQLETLQEVGCNALRTSHNPPAPEFMELADRMGFLVMDEAFDCWDRRKTSFDFHLIFPDWHEQDLRAQIDRDRNSPSVILWSIGNEVGEQFTGAAGAVIGKELCDIVHEEDSGTADHERDELGAANQRFAAGIGCYRPELPGRRHSRSAREVSGLSRKVSR